jgi:hypothetical protein
MDWICSFEFSTISRPLTPTCRSFLKRRMLVHLSTNVQLMWKPKLCLSVHKGPPLDTNLINLNYVQYSNQGFLKPTLILSSHPRLFLQICLFPLCCSIRFSLQLHRSPTGPAFNFFDLTNHVSQNYWGFGSCQPYGIAKTRKRNVSETGPVSFRK